MKIIKYVCDLCYQEFKDSDRGAIRIESVGAYLCKIVRHGDYKQIESLHFCCIECLTKWFEQN